MTTKLTNRAIFGATVLAAIAWVAPLLWILALSFKPNELLAQRTDILFAPPYTLKNYADILGTSLVFRWIVNSCVVAFAQTILVLLLSSLAGYGFALGTVALDEIEKAGGSLRCCVGEIY